MPIRKGTGRCSDSIIADFSKRELGDISSISFFRRRVASEDIVLRLDLLRKLNKHLGCVNTVSFNESGDILVSGSDDRMIILWNWETGKIRCSFDSGHHSNVFQAKFMPCSDDRCLVSCAADGLVRHALIRESGVDTKLLAKHERKVHSVAIEPGSPHIVYSCGEDGLVQHIDLRTKRATHLFICAPMSYQGCHRPLNLNAITINPRNPNLFAIGGGDQFARLFDIRRYNWDGSSDFGLPVDYFCPPHLLYNESVGITGMEYSEQNELLLSYNEDFIYLFGKNTGLGPQPDLTSQDRRTATSSPSIADPIAEADIVCYKGHMNYDTMKNVSFFGPRCEYVASGSDCGHIFIWKKKNGELVRVMDADKHIVNTVECHPHATVLASSGIEHDIKIWTPSATDRATLPSNVQMVFEDDQYSLFPYRGGSSEEDLSGTNDDDDDGNVERDADDEDNGGDHDGGSDNDNGDVTSSSAEDGASVSDSCFSENEEWS